MIFVLYVTQKKKKSNKYKKKKIKHSKKMNSLKNGDVPRIPGLNFERGPTFKL